MNRLLCALSASVLPAFGVCFEYSAALQIGNAWNAPEYLTIVADDPTTASYDQISFHTQPETRGLTTSPVYYSVRFGAWKEQEGLEIELLHQKIFLNNVADLPEIDRFEVTHGYNMVMLNKVFETESATRWRIGAGTIASYPSITINGQSKPPKADGGDPLSWLRSYYWGGYALQLGAEKTLLQWGRHHLIAEVKVSAGEALLPVSEGTLLLPNKAVHLLFGYSFR